MDNQTSKRIRNTKFPATMRVLGPFRESLLDEQIEQLLIEAFPGSSPEDVENFARNLQRFGASVGRVAQRALPGVIQGASAGAALGPYGALVGALAGGGASLIAGGRQAQPRPVQPAPRVPTTAPPAQTTLPKPTTRPTHTLPPKTGGTTPTQIPARAMASPATAQLLSLLARPETMQALLSMLMGSAGRGRVAVGRQQIPVQTFANSIAELASQAAQEATQLQDSHSEFFMESYSLNDSDDPRCDAYNPIERAALLVQKLNEQAEKRRSEQQSLRRKLEREEDLYEELEHEEGSDDAIYPTWVFDQLDSAVAGDENEFINAYESALEGVNNYG